MNKRTLHHYWRYARNIKTWQLILIFLLFLLASVWSLRQNSLRIGTLAQQVLQADEAGEGIEQALQRFGDYKLHHMNTRISHPIQLEHSYQRAYQENLKRAEATSNGGIYRRAQDACEDPNKLLSERAACIQDYVTRNAPPGRDPELVESPDIALFTYDYASPIWSPDPAGLLLLLTGLTGLLLVARFIAGKWVEKTLKEHQ